jgi:hypothetical protein
MNRYLVLFLSSLCFITCVDAHAEAFIFNRQLIRSYQHLHKTLRTPRPALRFESGRLAHTCLEYFEGKKVSTIAESVDNQIVMQDYLICDSVLLLKQAHVKRFSRHQPHSYGKDLLQRLDLTSFPSSLRQSLDDKHVVLGKQANMPAKAVQFAAISDTDDWLFKLEVVAEFDMDGDGEQDWLLWMTDSAKKGNYRSYGVLIVRAPYRNALLRAEIVP